MNNMQDNIRPNIIENGTPLFCDLYHLTMAQAWFDAGKAEETKTSGTFFRRNPFGGSFLINAGLGELVQWLKNWHFTKEDIAYLSSLKNAKGAPLFNAAFLDYIYKTPLQIDLYAAPEGEVLFPNEPAYSVTGPCWQVDLVEAAILNAFNSQSLFATKANRMVYAASLDGVKRPVLEFGLRRGHEFGGFSETRGAFIGGAIGTSNVAAAKHYNIPAVGTMAHSFMMSFESELDAFKAYMQASPGNTVLLVDTYDTYKGIQNAIRASKETGIELMGIRIDSGDLAYWGKEARRLFDEAGPEFKNTKLIASNDLDEHLIENLVMVQKAPYDTFAAGTKLVTAYDTPALGGVYKTKEYMGAPKIKVAEGKTTIPHATDIVRIVRNGRYEGDIICKADENIVENGKLTRNVTSYKLGSVNGSKMSFAKGETAYRLLKPVMIKGKVVNMPELDLHVLQKRTLENVVKLDESYKRLQNPHTYGVGLEAGLYAVQQQLIKAHQGRE